MRNFLSDLPEDILLEIVNMVFRVSPLSLGVQRKYGVVGTTMVIRDEKIYRRSNVPPTPVVKRAMMLMWSQMQSGNGIEILTMGTGHVIRYNCSVRGFRGGASPSELSHMSITDSV